MPVWRLYRRWHLPVSPPAGKLEAGRQREYLMTVEKLVPNPEELPARDPNNLPPLENGDRLTRDEFERRYQAIPHLKKAELIQGVVYIPSHYGAVRQSSARAEIVGWLGVYTAGTPGVRLGANATVRLDVDNEPQPDALLRLEPSAGGQSRISDDGYVEGAPEFIAEVAASSASYDVGDLPHSLPAQWGARISRVAGLRQSSGLVQTHRRRVSPPAAR